MKLPRQMKTTETQYAAKSKEFVKKGAEVYAKA